MKLVTAFFMAWGNFITLPCPYKKWDSKLLNMMLAFLPLVGAIIGGLWFIAIEVMKYFQLPDQVTAFIGVFVVFGLCGFMHMDGFMDCNDAILSRRPLEERQRILKDSNVGAFAVVSVVMLLIGWYAAMTAQLESTSFSIYFFIPILSRSCSGRDVLGCEPIGHSQYAPTHKDGSKGKYYAAMGLQLVLLFAIWIAIFGVNSLDPGQLIVLVIEVLACETAGLYGRHQLGGMSGDIAGYIICFGEFAAILAAAIIL